jgi:hypothetical protein
MKSKTIILLIAIMMIPLLAISCNKKNKNKENQTQTNNYNKKPNGGAKMETIQITSPAFDHGGMIPSKYTCDGEDISPPLEWQTLPTETKSIAIIADDPDAPGKTWVHWLIWNLPPSFKSLDENIEPSDELAGATQGTTDFGRVGYGGPCPPGGTHRYFFKIYALDETLDLEPYATKKDLVEAMQPSILAQGELMGKYARKK